jgi:hypothetical protein
LKQRRQLALGPEMEKELALKRDAGQFSDTKWSTRRSHPARRSTHQTAKPMPRRMTRHRTASQNTRSRTLPGVSFMEVSPRVVPKPRLGTLPHRQERLNAQAWPVRQLRIPAPCYRRRSGRVVRQNVARPAWLAPLAQSRAKRKRDVTLESGAVLTKHSPVRCPGKHNVSIQE